MGGKEFAELLTVDVMNVLGNGATRPIVRKKAALCLLRLLRKAPPNQDIMPAEVGCGGEALALGVAPTARKVLPGQHVCACPWHAGWLAAAAGIG